MGCKYERGGGWWLRSLCWALTMWDVNFSVAVSNLSNNLRWALTMWDVNMALEKNGVIYWDGWALTMWDVNYFKKH